MLFDRKFSGIQAPLLSEHRPAFGRQRVLHRLSEREGNDLYTRKAGSKLSALIWEYV